MVNYRRNLISGGTYFFTANLKDRRSRYLVDYVDQLRAAIRFTQTKQPFEILAVVILPEHCHMIWQLPQGDDDYPGRWKGIKSHFTRSITKLGAPIAKNKKGEYALWQKRYWEHTIKDDTDLQHHIDYIHYNPVKHGLVERAIDWPYSSFHRYVRNGQISEHWGMSDKIEDNDKYGE
jgi:putative transposase